MPANARRVRALQRRVVGVEKLVAVLAETSVLNLVDDGRPARRQHDEIAVGRRNDLFDAEFTGEFGVLGEMERLAVRRDGDLRADPAVELRNLGSPGVSRDVDELRPVGDDLDPLQHQPVHDAGHLALVAGNGAGREDDTVAGGELDLGMIVAGEPGERGAHLALAAGRDDDRLVAGEVTEAVRTEERRDAVEIAAFPRDRDGTVHGTADHDDAAPRGERRVRHRPDPGDVGREGRHQHTVQGRRR